MPQNFGLTAQGLRIKLLDEILFELGVSRQSVFGEEVNLDPATSILAQLDGSYSERDALLWELFLAVYVSAFPDSAEGVSLDNVAAITAISRLAATRSLVVGKCTGTVGTPLLAGRIASVEGTGARFRSQVNETIGGGGFVDVTFEAEALGEIQAPAGSLTVIETPVSGWASIINEEDADLGRGLETDVELRLRRRESLQIIGAATVDAIRARILDEVDSVTDVLVVENDTDIIDGAGRPPHSFQTIVAGGIDQEIGDKIWEVKPAGIQPYGTDVTVVVTDSQGVDHDIKFDRATILRSFMHIQIEVGTGFNIGSKQKEKVTVSTNDPGDTITLSINGRDFPITAGATKAATAQLLANAVQAGGADWLPVTASQDTPGTDEYFYLESDLDGNPFIFSWISLTTNSSLVFANQVLNSGSQGDIIDDVIEFAEGSVDFPKEQTIGKDLFLSRYFTPINLTLLVESISITTTSGDESADYWPTTAPPGGGDWAAADISAGAEEVVDLDTLRVTVEVV